jgi:Bacterial Ig domain
MNPSRFFSLAFCCLFSVLSSVARGAPTVINDVLTVSLSGTTTLDVLANDTGGTLTIDQVGPAHTGTVNTDGSTLTFTPTNGFNGYDSFTYTVSDSSGSAVGVVVVYVTQVLRPLIAVTGNPVPFTTGFPTGSTWRDLNIPGLSFVESWQVELGFKGTVSTPNGVATGLFSFTSNMGLVTRLKTGDTATDADGQPISGATFDAFREPVFAETGFAVVARVQGDGSTGSNRKGLWARRDILTPLRQVARFGGSAPGVAGGTYASIDSLAMPRASVLFFTATLARGSGVVHGVTDQGLWVWTPNAGLSLVLRQGTRIDFGRGQKTVKTFRALENVPGSPGEPRYVADEKRISLVLKFTDGNQVLATANQLGVVEARFFSGDEVVPNAKVSAFSQADRLVGRGPVAIARIDDPPDSNAPVPSSWIVDFSSSTVLAAQGQSLQTFGLTGKLDRFLPPAVGFVPNSAGSFVPGTAFLGFFSDPSNDADSGILLVRGNAPGVLSPFAIKTRVAPGTSNAAYAEFLALAMAPESGPVFVARLADSATVTANNDVGLWGTNGNSVRLLLREGDSMAIGAGGLRVVSSFDTLSFVSGSPGQGRAVYLPRRDTLLTTRIHSVPVAFRAHFKGGTTGIGYVTVP